MSMHKHTNPKLRENQQGMAAITITVVLMMVISVIVLGFAQVVRREQRNSLDNQLATQAFYAAESGVNLAQERIEQQLASGTPIADKTDCGETGVINPGDYDIGEAAEVTCLLLDSHLETLEYQKIGLESVPLLVKADSGANVENLYISWQSSVNPAVAGCPASPTAHSFAPGPTWGCSQPLLRIDLVPVNGMVPAATLAASQFTAFLYPTTAGLSSTPYAGTKDGIVAANCSAARTTQKPRTCVARITGLNSNAYAMRIMSIYGEADVSILAASGGGALKTLIEGQVLIDVTARASDVLKRVQARVSSTASVPDFGITASGQGVCKKYVISGQNLTNPGGACAIP